MYSKRLACEGGCTSVGAAEEGECRVGSGCDLHLYIYSHARLYMNTITCYYTLASDHSASESVSQLLVMDSLNKMYTGVWSIRHDFLLQCQHMTRGRAKIGNPNKDNGLEAR